MEKYLSGDIEMRQSIRDRRARIRRLIDRFNDMGGVNEEHLYEMAYYDIYNRINDLAAVSVLQLGRNFYYQHTSGLAVYHRQGRISSRPRGAVRRSLDTDAMDGQNSVSEEMVRRSMTAYLNHAPNGVFACVMGSIRHEQLILARNTPNTTGTRRPRQVLVYQCNQYRRSIRKIDNLHRIMRCSSFAVYYKGLNGTANRLPGICGALAWVELALHFTEDVNPFDRNVELYELLNPNRRTTWS